MPIKGYLWRSGGRRAAPPYPAGRPQPASRAEAARAPAPRRAAPRGKAGLRSAGKGRSPRSRSQGHGAQGSGAADGAGGTAVGEGAACPADCPRVTACGALAAARPPAQAGAARIPAFMAAAPRHPCEDGRFGSGHDLRCRRVRSAAAAPAGAPGRGALPFFWVCPAAGPAAISRGRAVRGRPRRLRAARDAAGRPGGVFI